LICRLFHYISIEGEQRIAVIIEHVYTCDDNSVEQTDAGERIIEGICS
jgi:hypothetical protein